MSATGEDSAQGDLAPLLAAAARGDDGAWRDIIDRYAKRVFALAKSRCRNVHVAEEIAQSVFATIATKMASGGYVEQGKFESWLFRVAANRVRDHIRHVRRRPERADSHVLDGVQCDRRDTEDGVATAALRKAMDALADADREIVELRHHAGLSFNQIAEVLEEPLGTLLARHHRALKKLREMLEPTASKREQKP